MEKQEVQDGKALGGCWKQTDLVPSATRAGGWSPLGPPLP